ncbi:MAG: phytanoyl-CoA dioxygenase family protein [Acidimicrobiia bacterium]
MTPMSQQLAEKGFVVARGVLTPDEVAHYRSLLIERSEIMMTPVRRHGRGGHSWNNTDGVSKDPAFWDLIWHQRLLAEVDATIGSGFKYLQHSDLQVGFSAIAWHRDNVNRTLGVGPDWDETEGPYGLVRVGIYLQSYEESGFRLGFIPRSHRFSPEAGPTSRWTRETGYRLQGGLAYLGPRFQNLTRSAEWVATNPGDAIIFDPRILHSGSYIQGLKLSMFVGYGHENRHFADLQNYYRNVRTELGYRAFDPELVDRLREHHLFADSVEDSDQVDEAYVPSAPIRKLVERRVRTR